ncbi:MAG: phenylalanine--tRNA ligase subunit beta, partial [Nanoarchaeota archaeon]|nr:phenylalanine--tRNA ligase subunit beta [Nanoarchaeota archaeon]
MPSIVINKKVFEKAIGKKIPLQELKDRISMLGTDLEKIEGNEIHVEIFPDRPDMLSEQGFARAFATFTGIKTGLRKYDVKPFGSHITSTPNKEWPFVLAAVVKGLKFDDDKIKDIIQVQEKLHTTLLRNRKKGGIGIYPLDKLKFPIRFTAEDPDKIKFRPLEYQSEITGRQILSKHPTGRAYAHTCEKWNKFPVFRDANNNILSMPPIINSHDTGKITEKTKDVFIEATGTDFDALQSCINIIVTTLADLGGKIFSVEMRYPNKKFISPNLKPQKMSLDIAHVNKLLGLDLTAQTVKKLLLRMGFG